MKIGQVFYKLGKTDQLTSFADHEFEVIKIFGIKPSELYSVLEVSKNRTKSSELASVDYKQNHEIRLDVTVKQFLDLSEIDQNNLIKTSNGYTPNLSDLIQEHKLRTTDQIALERQNILEKESRLKDIETSLN